MGMLGNQLAAGQALTVANDSFNGDGSTTSFTLSQTVGSVHDIEVLVDNVQQSPYDGSYSVSGTTLTFSGTPSTGTNNIYVIYNASKHITTQQVIPDDGSVTHSKFHTTALNPITLDPTNNSANIGGRFQVGDSSITQAYPAANLGYVMDVQASTGSQTYISIAEPGASSLGDNGMIIGEDTTNSWIVQRGNKGMNFSTNDLGRLLIDGAGRVSTPYQPAFQAKRSNHVTSSGTIIFDAVQYNIGNHYNSSNGIFTAPVSGTYLFTFACLLYNMGSASNAHLFVNGSAYNMSSFGTYGQFTGSYAGQGASCVTSLSTNDQVTINFSHNGTNLHSGYTWWSGAKIG